MRVHLYTVEPPVIGFVDFSARRLRRLCGARHRRRSTSQLVRDQLAGDKAEFPLAFLISTTRLGAAPIHAVAWNGRDTQLILVSRGASSRRIVSNHFSLVLALLSFESVT